MSSHMDSQIFKVAVLCQILTMLQFSVTSYSATKRKKLSELRSHVIRLDSSGESPFLLTQNQIIINFNYTGNSTNMTSYHNHISGTRAWNLVHFGIQPTKVSRFKKCKTFMNVLSRYTSLTGSKPSRCRTEITDNLVISSLFIL